MGESRQGRPGPCTLGGLVIVACWQTNGAKPLADDLKDTISTNAQGPAEASGGSVRAKQHSLPDQIAADKYIASNNAMSSNRKTLGLRMVKIKPPGAC